MRLFAHELQDLAKRILSVWRNEADWNFKAYSSAELGELVLSMKHAPKKEAFIAEDTPKPLSAYLKLIADKEEARPHLLHLLGERPDSKNQAPSRTVHFRIRFHQNQQQIVAFWLYGEAETILNLKPILNRADAFFKDYMPWNFGKVCIDKSNSLVPDWVQFHRELRQLGGDLFHETFQGALKEQYSEHLHRAQIQGAHLCLHICTDSKKPSDVNLIPWEILYEPSQRNHLSMSNGFSLVRELTCRTLPPTTLPLPLRVLFVGESQDKKEVTTIKQVIGGHRNIRFDFLQNLDQFAMATYLKARSEPVHILHFIGHGSINEQLRESFLELQDSQGNTFHASTRILRNELAANGLKMIIFNVCSGGLSPNKDPLAGLAVALLHAGVPEVVSMRSKISHRTARLFSIAFYKELCLGTSTETAVSAARRAIYNDASVSNEWIYPAHYSAMLGPNNVSQ